MRCLNNIKVARKNAEIGQKEIAINLKVSQSTVSDWENGRKTPSGENLLNLASLLSCDPAYLLGKSNIPNPNADDDEFWEIRQLMAEKPGARTLFSLAKTANNDTLEFAGEMIRRMQKESGYSDD